jgi:hypothetical protein
MPYTEASLRPYVKLIVEEMGKVNTTELISILRDRLVLDDDDLMLLENRNDDRFSQVVRNLVRYPPNKEGVLEGYGYIIDKNTSPATFYAKLIDSEKISVQEIDRRKARRNRYISRRVDFEARSEENQLIGDAGERFVVDYERTRLSELGARFNLLEEVIQVSKVYGDGAGYDILSKKDEKGENLYIEVKTTKGDINTPFYISKNELTFLEEYQDLAWIYRVYNFSYDKNLGEIYEISYSHLQTDFTINPTTFIIKPKKTLPTHV